MRDEITAVVYGKTRVDIDPKTEDRTGQMHTSKQMADQPEIRLMSERFGEITYTPEAVITFAGGLVGFEELRDFIIIDITGCEPFQWLISIDNSTVGFPVIRAGMLDTTYEQAIIHEADIMYGLDAEYMIGYSIATMLPELMNSTVNLRAPVIINVEQRTGQQVILVSETYSTEFPLFQVIDETERG